jgi:AcrR family transcriptional regulator
MTTKTGPKTGQLLKAASEVFHEHGFHRAKVSDITAAAGVAQGTFYLYFSSKEEIFLELLRRFALDLQEAVLDFSWTDMESIDELTEGLHRELVGIFTVCSNQRTAAALFFEGAAAVSEEAAAIPRQFLDEAEKIVVGYLTDGLEMGHLRPLDLEIVARAIVGYVLHTLTQTIVREGRTDDLDELAGELLKFELYGILATREVSP